MTSLGAASKAARATALTQARAALKGAGASETSGGSAGSTKTASAKTGRSSHAGLRVRKVRLRKIRIRV